MGLTAWENAPDGRILKSDSINAFLEFRRYDILRDNGKVSHRQALEKAYHEYEIFSKTQPIESDFDKVVKEIENKRQMLLNKSARFVADSNHSKCMKKEENHG